MNKNTAKKLLLEQKKKLDSNSNRNSTWVFHTASIIEGIFGKESAEFNYIGQFKFGTWSHNYETKEAIAWRIEEKIITIKQFIDNCIETVEVKGVYLQPKLNFLSRLSDTALWTILPFLVSGIFYSGVLYNEYNESKNIKKLESELKNIRDSLSVAVPTLSDSQPITKSGASPKNK